MVRCQHPTKKNQKHCSGDGFAEKQCLNSTLDLFGECSRGIGQTYMCIHMYIDIDKDKEIYIYIIYTSN